MTKYILLTRPKVDSEKMAYKLAKYNFQSLIEPLITIIPRLNWQIELKKHDIAKCGLLIFTSSNAVQEFCRYFNFRAIKVALVGNTTKQVAQNFGFDDIIYANDVEELLKVIPKVDKKVIYLAGNIVTIEICSILRTKGYNIDKIILYDAKASISFSNNLCQALVNQEIKAVTLFSYRTATIFNQLYGQQNFSLTKVKLFAISSKVAAAVAQLAWQQIFITQSSTADEMVRILGQNL